MNYSYSKYNYCDKDYNGCDHSSRTEKPPSRASYNQEISSISQLSTANFHDYMYNCRTTFVEQPLVEQPRQPKIYINPNSLSSMNSVHVNKSKFNINSLPASTNSREKLSENKIHYNPKFFSNSSVSKKSSKIHVNPSFAQNLIVDNTDSKMCNEGFYNQNFSSNDKIYFNPKFLEYDSEIEKARSSNIATNIVTNETNKIPHLKTDDLKPKVSYNSKYSKINQKPVSVKQFSKISKYKINRVNPKPNPDGSQSLSSQLIVVPTRKPKLSGSFKKIGKRKLVRKSLVQNYIASRRQSVPSMIIHSRKTISSKKLNRKLSNKYKIVRQSSLNKSLNTIKKIKSKKDRLSKFKWNKSVNISRNDFIKLGNRKIVRKSLLQSILHAQRSRVYNPVKYTPNKKYLSTKQKFKKSVKPVRSRFRVRNNGAKPSSQQFLPKSSEVSKFNSTVNNTKRKDVGNLSYILSKSIYFRMPTNVRLKIRLEEKRKRLLLMKKVNNKKKCSFYNRFGYCKGLDEGTCKKLHDVKNIAICRKFLKGVCTGDDCKLSHNVIAEKMPICHQFLAGVCVRTPCPFLHVKLSHDRPICSDFLQGFCLHGDNCTKRHQFICPEWSEKGHCLTDKCKYPHPQPINIKINAKEKSTTTNMLTPAKSDDTKIQTNEIISSENTADEIKNRYFTKIVRKESGIVSEDVYNEINVERKIPESKDGMNSVYENEALLCFIPFS